MNVRTEEVAEGILVSRMTLSMKNTDSGAYIQTAQGRAVKIMAVVETVGRHPTRWLGYDLETTKVEVEGLPSDRESWLYLESPSSPQWGATRVCPA